MMLYLIALLIPDCDLAWIDKNSQLFKSPSEFTSRIEKSEIDFEIVKVETWRTLIQVVKNLAFVNVHSYTCEK